MRAQLGVRRVPEFLEELSRVVSDNQEFFEIVVRHVENSPPAPTHQ